MCRILYLFFALRKAGSAEVDIGQDNTQDCEGQEELSILVEGEDPFESILDLKDDLTQAGTERSVQALQDNPQTAEQDLAHDKSEALEHILATHVVPGKQAK